jgi:hypothetical protein
MADICYGTFETCRWPHGMSAHTVAMTKAYFIEGLLFLFKMKKKSPALTKVPEI